MPAPRRCGTQHVAQARQLVVVGGAPEPADQHVERQRQHRRHRPSREPGLPQRRGVARAQTGEQPGSGRSRCAPAPRCRGRHATYIASHANPNAVTAALTAVVAVPTQTHDERDGERHEAVHDRSPAAGAGPRRGRSPGPRTRPPGRRSAGAGRSGLNGTARQTQQDDGRRDTRPRSTRASCSGPLGPATSTSPLDHSAGVIPRRVQSDRARQRPEAGFGDSHLGAVEVLEASATASGRAGPGSASRTSPSRRGARPARRAGRSRAGRSSCPARA